MGYTITEDNYLAHFGVKGMKWGVRKAQVKTMAKNYKKSSDGYKQKLDSIVKTGAGKQSSDHNRFAYAKQSLPRRIRQEAVKAAKFALIADAVSGKLDYTKMSKTDINKRLLGIAKQATIQVVTKSTLAARASKNYDTSGNLKTGVKRKGKTQEDRLEKIPAIARTVTKAAKLGRYATFAKAESARRNRSENEDKYRRAERSGKVLESRVDDVVWKASDGKSTIITNPREGAKNVTPRRKI